ncbi:hypothetical protein [Microbacterium oleivorans]|uniref:hypothetical protein n=1 Tax=Microbacterium oleivorans TaxID=273677 RepID=UPI00203ACA08|nr:hypothetical protein [Microbacterium oleivorans]MCM3696067.1 hypothetical protein [Microbacterium oleivorans]
MRLQSARALWDMVDGPMPRGLLGVGSGDLVLNGDRSLLFLGGYSTSFRNRLYVAESVSGSSLVDTDWAVQTDRRGRARAIVADPPRTAWDGGGMHTPSYLPASGAFPARIYYAARSGRSHVGPTSRYSIGVLEMVEGRWQRSGEPLVAGDDERPSALEPRVVRESGRHVMWYLATPHEVAAGELPDYELRCTTSLDGITGWSEPRTFATSREGFFDVALARIPEGWVIVLARGTNLHRTSPYPAQGLWTMTAASASPDRAAWSAPRRILDTDDPDTPAWMSAGVCDPAVHIDTNGGMTVFVTGTRRYRSWWALALDRLRHGRTPPVPAPFHLATGVLTFRD